MCLSSISTYPSSDALRAGTDDSGAGLGWFILKYDIFRCVFIWDWNSVVYMIRRLVVRVRAMAKDGGSAERTDRGHAGGVDDRQDRGQSELVGTVLILGLSMMVIGTSIALGGVALADLVEQAESDNVENGMSHLSSKISLVALGDADSQRFDLGMSREGTVSVRPEAGSITISNMSGDSRDELFNSSLGAIVYEGGDRGIAYQGGGIWTKRSNTSRLTSPPEFHYRETTLTLPIIQVHGEGAIGGQPSGRVTPVDVAQDAIPGVSTPLENGTIEIEIQSQYYQGWDEYLSTRTEGETTVYHENETVVSRLTVPDVVTFDTALSLQSDLGSGDIKGSAEVNPDGSWEENVAHRSAKPLIDTKIEAARETNDNGGCLTESGIDGDCTISSGTYFIDEDTTLNGNLDIDTTGGNVTIVVDGTFDIVNNEITVTDTETDNGVNYYINGSLQATGNAYVGTDGEDAESVRNVFYVGDGFLDGGTGTIELDAIIYAPDADINSAGKGEITGSIVANSIEKLNGNMDINYDSDLDEKTIEVTGAADLLKYLHISHNEVEVDLE